MPSFPLKLRSLSHPRLLLGAYYYMLTCLQPPRTGGRGICSAQPTRCLRIIGRHLGCRHRIRTSSPGYEPGELPLLHHCDMISLSHFGIIIIPQFCLFVKIHEYVEKEGGSLVVYQPWYQMSVPPRYSESQTPCVTVTLHSVFRSNNKQVLLAIALLFQKRKERKFINSKELYVPRHVF